MSSVLKSILMLQKGVVPPQAGMPHSMNPNVLKFLQDDSSIEIPTEPTQFYTVAEKPKRILVNNFDAAVSLFFLHSPKDSRGNPSNHGQLCRVVTHA